MSLTELLHRNHPTVTYYIFTYNLKITLFYVKCVFDNSLKEKTLLVCVSVPNSQEKHPQKFLSTSNLISIIDITEDFLCAHTLRKLTWDHFCNGNHLLLGGTIDLMCLKVSSRVHSFPHRANAINLFPGFCVCVFSFFFQMDKEMYWSAEVMFQEFASLQHTDYTQQSPRSVSYRRSHTHTHTTGIDHPLSLAWKSNTFYRWLTSKISRKLVMWPQFSLSKSTSPPYAFLKNHDTDHFKFQTDHREHSAPVIEFSRSGFLILFCLKWLGKITMT